MECPKCFASFYPQINYRYLGENKRRVASAIYWEVCPQCDQFIIFLKESANGNDILNMENLEPGMIIYPR